MKAANRLLPLKIGASLLFWLVGVIPFHLRAQPLHGDRNFTRQDSLRGSLGPYRTWWDVQQYEIHVQPDFDTKTISGTTIITFRVLQEKDTMQIDLQEPLVVDSITWGRHHPRFIREGNVYWVLFPEKPKTGSDQALMIRYHGKPREAVRPPWDGGWIWKKDANGRPWMSVACQGLGASVWYPCKDHQSDEPDRGALLSITAPDTLVAVGNGRLRATHHDPGKHLTTWNWAVVNPINNYDIIPYIGKYVHWGEVFPGAKGPLDCNYWVLDYNEEKARSQFKQATSMLKCFEYWFGPYPFYEDGYKLVESPHLGMEHQSAVAYGNRFENGYLGRDLSGTGWGNKWDFIIVHESGHEWFGNNITSNDIADMWVHEGFTNYSETIYTTCEFGTEAGDDYCIGTRRLIRNDKPVIGPYGVNQEGSGDMYYKGGNLLHTIRQIIDNDSVFRDILRGLNRDFYHKIINSSDVEKYISEKSGRDLSPVFNQYLRTTQIPVLEYKFDGYTLLYHWINCIPGFNMPLKITIGKEMWIEPGNQWKEIKFAGFNDPSLFAADRNFYINLKKVEKLCPPYCK